MLGTRSKLYSVFSSDHALLDCLIGCSLFVCLLFVIGCYLFVNRQSVFSYCMLHVFRFYFVSQYVFSCIVFSLCPCFYFDFRILFCRVLSCFALFCVVFFCFCFVLSCLILFVFYFACVLPCIVLSRFLLLLLCSLLSCFVSFRFIFFVLFSFVLIFSRGSKYEIKGSKGRSLYE